MATIAKRVAAAMEKIAPLRLAEKWDNVGLLVESPVSRSDARQVLLTIDLTTAVCNEALSTHTSTIIAYHPPLFRPLSSLTMSNPLQASLLRCVAAGVSIYSPHTAVDSVKNGVNDWLASAFNNVESVETISQADGEEEGTGIGRLVRLNKPLQLQDIYPLVKRHLNLQHLQVAKGSTSDIKTIAICAGSGGSVLKGVQADLYWTGELSHHEVLAAVAEGRSVVLCGHSNTERGYLVHLKERLESELAGGGDTLEIKISQEDKDPLVVV